jgi:hypothetical protein
MIRPDRNEALVHHTNGSYLVHIGVGIWGRFRGGGCSGLGLMILMNLVLPIESVVSI